MDQSLPPNVVQLPHFIFETLRLAAGDVVLLTRPSGVAFVAAQAEVAEGQAIRLSRFACERLGQPDSQFCDVHRPLGTAARAEAMRVNEAAPVGQGFVSDPLLDAVDELESLVELAQAAAIGRTIHFDSPRGVLLAGLNSVEFPRDAMYFGPTERPKRMVPAPPPPPPKNRNPTNEEIDRVIQTCAPHGCLFLPAAQRCKVAARARTRRRAPLFAARNALAHRRRQAASVSREAATRFTGYISCWLAPHVLHERKLVGR